MPFAELARPRTQGYRWSSDYEHANRPFVEVEFAATSDEGLLLGRSIRTALLLDSGARSTVLNGTFAPALGLDLSLPLYPKDSIGGIVPGYGLRVALVGLLARVCDVWIDLAVAFTLDPVPTQDLLGRDGFFDVHTVAFLHRERTILVEPEPPRRAGRE